MVNLTWSASTNANAYNLKRAQTNGGPYAVIASGLTGAAFTDTGLADGTSYYYVVSSSNPGGESGNSSQAAAQPVSLSAPMVSVSAASGRLQIGWPTDHTGWTLQVQTNTAAQGLGTNWVNVSGSGATNQFSLPVNGSNPSVFYRLYHP